jgi:hypothetical protein
VNLIGRCWAWRRAHLRFPVIGAAVAVPLVLTAVLFLVVLKFLQATVSQDLGFVGAGLLVIGAVLQVFASTREIKDREGTAVVDGFVLAGWMVIFVGAALSFASVIVAIHETTPVG